MKLQAIEPIAEIDICHVLYFTAQKLVVVQKPLDKESQQNLVLAKHANGTAYVLHNFGSDALRAKNCVNHLHKLLSCVCGLKPKPTVDVSPQVEG